jgi:hypothetical protein
MIPFHLDSSEKLFFDTFRLGCEAHSLMGLRLFEMATGGVPALPEALRMIPEKIAAFADAQMVVATSVLAGRPDLAPRGRCPLSRARERQRAAAHNVTGRALALSGSGPRGRGYLARESIPAVMPSA